MTSLHQFLLGCLAEDETAARDRADIEAEWTRRMGGTVGGIVPDLVSPDRMLAECAAKRALITVAFETAASVDGEFGCAHYPEQIAVGECEEHPVDGIRELRILAAIYADHPDYRLEWRPGPTGQET